MAKTSPLDLLYYALLYLVLVFAAADVSSQVILRGELIALPDLRGLTTEEARAALAAKRLSLAIQEYAFDTRLERDRVISQDPSAGSRLKANRTVRIVVSQGSEQIAVPRLEGRGLEASTQSLKTAGLRRGLVAQIHTPRFAAGRVIVQDPPAGQVVSRGTAIDLLVSQGGRDDRYLMPDLIDRNAADVQRALRELGFRVMNVRYAYYPYRDPGVVLNQKPIPGQRVQKSTLIELEISK